MSRKRVKYEITAEKFQFLFSNKAVATTFLFLSFVVSNVAAAHAGETFNNPRQYIGNRYWTIDWCMPSDCSKEARWVIAKAYCQEEGYQEATKWRVAPDNYKNQVQYQLIRGGTEGRWQEVHNSQGIFSQIKCE